MKKISLFFLMFYLLGPCVFADTYRVDTNASKAEWLGKKVTGQHHGAIKIESAQIQFEGEDWTGGEAVMDMNSLTVEDITNPVFNKKLTDHLHSADFFDTESYPTAALKITGVENLGGGEYEAQGDFTIKGTTQSIRFPVTLSLENGVVSAHAAIRIDRTLFDIRYGSGKFFQGLGDKMIDDFFGLNVEVTAHEAAGQ